MSETPSSRPSSPPPTTRPSSPPPPTTPSAKEGESKTKKFEGDGFPFKGKLIGMEDLPIDRDEKVCLEAMFKLKAVVRARGEHKQKIQLNLTMSAVKVIDDITKAQIASHEIERISFVAMDPRDTRAFGYIYNTSDDRHQFWAIKTERSAAFTVIALRELFDAAFEQYTNAGKIKEEADKPITTPPPPSSPIASSEETVRTQEPSPAAPVSSPPPPPPSISELPQAAPVSPPSVQESHASNTTPSLLDDLLWEDSHVPTNNKITQPPPKDIWNFDEPALPVIQPTPTPVDPLADIFDSLSTSPTIPSGQPPASTGTNNPLFDVFSITAPTPPPPAPAANQYGNVYNLPVQPNVYNATPTFPPQQQQQQQQQRPVPSTVPLPQQQQQQDFSNAAPMSPVGPATVTSPFAGLDFLGGLSLGSTTGAKPTKESFFPTVPPPKTVQQLLMEKQP